MGKKISGLRRELSLSVDLGCNAWDAMLNKTCPKCKVCFYTFTVFLRKLMGPELGELPEEKLIVSKILEADQ